MHHQVEPFRPRAERPPAAFSLALMLLLALWCGIVFRFAPRGTPPPSAPVGWTLDHRSRPIPQLGPYADPHARPHLTPEPDPRAAAPLAGEASTKGGQR